VGGSIDQRTAVPSKAPIPYWLNKYVGDGADDWGNPPPHPHRDAAYAKLASNPLFIEACDAAYAKRIP
jgi:hypothetical protein